MRPLEPAPPPGLGPTVSIVMANFNGAAHLADAIESARRQTLSDLEIIISDDASTDGSIDIIRRLMTEDRRIRLVQSEHKGGPASARNRAIAVATGAWIAIMDSDDLMQPTRLAMLIEAALRDGADMVADDLLAFDTDNFRHARPLLKGRWARGPLWVDIVDYVRVNHFFGSGPELGYLKPVFRSSIAKEPAARYDESLTIAEDFDLVLRLLHSGKRLRLYPWRLYLYRKHGASISHRLSERTLRPLLSANSRFLDRISGSDGRLATALRARTRSIETALAYVELLDVLKARNWSRATVIVLAAPRAASLLRQPLGVRLRRLVPRPIYEAFVAHFFSNHEMNGNSHENTDPASQTSTISRR